MEEIKPGDQTGGAREGFTPRNSFRALVNSRLFSYTFMLALLMYILLCGYFLVYSGSLFVEAVSNRWYSADAAETDFREMTLWIDPSLGLPRKAQGLHHNGTEVRTIEFQKLTINPTLPESEFQFRPPPGVDVDEVENIRL